MDARELRIGNLLQIEDRGFVRVCTIWKEYFDVECDGKSYGGDFSTPIPLSPEILEKAGFKNSGNRYQIWFGDFEFQSVDNNGIVDVCCDGMLISLKFKYLHQVQNFYYMVTGEELNIEL